MRDPAATVIEPGLHVPDDDPALQDVHALRRLDVALEFAADERRCPPTPARSVARLLDGEIAVDAHVALEAAGNLDVAGALDLAFDRDNAPR